ncbi:biphenyl 2,3-dioxygenase [Pontibacillus litoralis JSM 072002]|uniref:Biphenyl 2,3-dioxygenase n=1 Tax=Pontibacillus litoralis JSM 072002 TaxID=1385512 RepID=A0A0A5G357_9BACI|nr:biphenyl 2,3-dioxygenase [Pontibacillus litoralis JSM 072002]
MLGAAIDHTRVGVIITDPNEQDNPIIFVNEGFQRITGYRADDIIGLNCRFLQGEGTDKKVINQLREAVQANASISTVILNYKKDGTPFWNELHIDPVYVEHQRKGYLVGIQKDITGQVHTEKNLSTFREEVSVLSTPIVLIAEGVCVLPIMGNMVGERMAEMVDNITSKVAKGEYDYLIMELSGLKHYDEEMIQGIFRLKDMLRLLGIELLIAGASPEFAMKSTILQLNLSSIKAFATVKQAIQSIEKIR